MSQAPKIQARQVKPPTGLMKPRRREISIWTVKRVNYKKNQVDSWTDSTTYNDRRVTQRCFERKDGFKDEDGRNYARFKIKFKADKYSFKCTAHCMGAHEKNIYLTKVECTSHPEYELMIKDTQLGKFECFSNSNEKIKVAVNLQGMERQSMMDGISEGELSDFEDPRYN